MSQDNIKLYGLFLLVNVLMVSFFGFDNETITFNKQSSLSNLQLLTTHFSHHSWTHFLGNMSGMLILLILFPRQNRMLMIAFMLCVTLVAAYVKVENIQTYLGASALLYCIPGCQFVDDLQCNPKKSLIIFSILCLYLFIISPMKEMNTEVTWTPLTGAHILGFLAGMMANVLSKTIKRTGLNHVKS